jgi:hypothetical protein
MSDEIEVPRCPVCLWMVYTRRADGTQTARLFTGYRPAWRAKLRTRLEPGDSVALVKFDREDRKTPRNRGGAVR